MFKNNPGKEPAPDRAWGIGWKCSASWKAVSGYLVKTSSTVKMYLEELHVLLASITERVGDIVPVFRHG